VLTTKYKAKFFGTPRRVLETTSSQAKDFSGKYTTYLFPFSMDLVSRQYKKGHLLSHPALYPAASH